MLAKINKQLDEVATLEHSKKEDTKQIIGIALKILAMLLTLRMSFPFKKAENKAKWAAWIDRIKTGELLSQIIIN